MKVWKKMEVLKKEKKNILEDYEKKIEKKKNYLYTCEEIKNFINLFFSLTPLQDGEYMVIITKYKELKKIMEDLNKIFNELINN